MSVSDDTTKPCRVRMLTPAGWLTGDLRVPVGSTLLDHLNRASGLMRLAKVRVEGHTEILPFAAVQRPWLRLVVPLDVGDDALPRGGGELHEVAGVLDVAAFQGNVRLAGAQRASDFFATAPAFAGIADCRVWHTRGPEAGQVSSLPLAFVHVPALVLVSDTLTG